MKAIHYLLPDTDFNPPDPTAIQGQMVTVPSVGGLSPADAANQLRQVGLNPVVGPQVDSGYAYGTVAYLSPGSGTQVASGSTVTIYVSNGNSGGDVGADDGDNDNHGPGNNNGRGHGNGGGRGRR
jgi:hypothetical protein